MSEDNEVIRQAAAEYFSEIVLSELQDALFVASSCLELDCDISRERAQRIMFTMFRRFMSRHMDKIECQHLPDYGAIFFGYVPIDENSAPYTPKDDSDDSDIGNIAA